MDNKKCLIEVVSGVEGPSVYINDYRVAGPKPWGGGKVIHCFIVDTDDIVSGMEGEFPKSQIRAIKDFS